MMSEKDVRKFIFIHRTNDSLYALHITIKLKLTAPPAGGAKLKTKNYYGQKKNKI